MEPGKTQKLWLKQLKQHPERQAKSILGEGTSRKYKACCLGELLLCHHRIKHKKLPFINNKIYDGGVSALNKSWEKLGLRSKVGSFKQPAETTYGFYKSLAEMNDGVLSWKEIAIYVEENPENVFIKSV